MSRVQTPWRMKVPYTGKGQATLSSPWHCRSPIAIPGFQTSGTALQDQATPTVGLRSISYASALDWEALRGWAEWDGTSTAPPLALWQQMCRGFSGWASPFLLQPEFPSLQTEEPFERQCFNRIGFLLEQAVLTEKPSISLLLCSITNCNHAAKPGTPPPPPFFFNYIKDTKFLINFTPLDVQVR